jgi:hypothetical protein
MMEMKREEDEDESFDISQKTRPPSRRWNAFHGIRLLLQLDKI